MAETFAGNKACEKVRRGDRGLEIGARDKVGVSRKRVLLATRSRLCVWFFNDMCIHLQNDIHCRIMGSHISLFVATATI